MTRNAATKAARLSVAPMMDWTDRHCRYFHRLMSARTLLYTEMVTAPALVRGGGTREGFAARVEARGDETRLEVRWTGAALPVVAPGAHISEAPWWSRRWPSP